MLRKLITGTAALGAVGGVAFACLGGAAQATTQDNVGLPPPKVQISNHIGWAFEGRFYLSRAPRAAKVTAAQLDITDITEAEPSFYFGEMQLRTYTSGGKPTTVIYDLWWFWFHRKEHRLTARVIPPATVDPGVHEDGTTVGTLSFAVPLDKTGLANHGNPLKKAVAELTLGGHTYPLTFSRNLGPSVPRAELYGR